MATVALLRRSFRALLAELCGSESRGRFWLAYSCVAVVLVSLFGALSAVPEADPSLSEGGPQVRLALSSFRSGLFGLILALSGIALVLLVSIGNREQRVEPPPRLPEPG